MTPARIVICVVSLLSAGAGFSHPLGNNTVNRQSALTVTAAGVELRYLFDLAEIPTLVATQDADRDQDGRVSEEEWRAYSRRWALQAASKLVITLNGAALDWELQNESWRLSPGEAGLFTLRLEAHYLAAIAGPPAIASLNFHDQFQPERAGWKEIRLKAERGVEISGATVPEVDRSRALTDFTLPLAALPPNELRASARLNLSILDSRSSILDSGSSPFDFRSTILDPVNPEPAAHSRSWTGQAWVFFKLGMHHIATGWDHMVFIFGLLLLSQSLMQLIKMVTAFTVAHSVTLVLAANGLVTPPGNWVEPAIALTIAYVGLVNLLWQNQRHGAWLAFFFGLVHGFGFAGALAETLTGQPAREANWLLSLAAFNFGIEAFQVLLVLTLAPLFALIARSSWSRQAQRFASVGVLGAGVGWLITRTLPWLA
jgi:hydrogenase/urease accessory protein HupE